MPRKSGRKKSARPEAPPAPSWRVAAAVCAWGLAAHLVFLRDNSATAFFVGDGLYFLQQARHLAAGTALDAGLPYHPPLVGWLLAPLWWMVAPARVLLAAKALMAVVNAATYLLLYLLLAPRLRHAALFLLLAPLYFGELMLSATPNSEAVYRLLLAALLLLGKRWPAAGGVLHGLAALTRAEHVAAGLALLVYGLARRPHRRFAAVTGAAAMAVLLPYTAATAVDLRAYNERHAATLPEPLPTVVPVSFYGPLNFALAHSEEGIHFSRRRLPPSGGDATLDPNHGVHNAYVVHGYRIGLEAIVDAPGRFLGRSWRKAVHSLSALAYGWTWRDLPKGDTWVRQPVDMAYARAPWYEVVAGLLMVLGAWRLRRDRWLLGVGFALVAYRLAVNVAFFPYLRSMMIAAPFALLLLFSGLEWLLRRYTPHVVGALWVGLALFQLTTGLALFQLTTGLGERRFLQQGERDAQGAILDDRPVVLTAAPRH
jgi:hypothetical protein